jgi:hypothetical protein
MLDFEGITPLPWEQFMELARLGEDKLFAILEQGRVEQCAVPPSPDNDVIIGVALVAWCADYVSVLKMYGQQDHPIANMPVRSYHRHAVGIIITIIFTRSDPRGVSGCIVAPAGGAALYRADPLQSLAPRSDNMS